MTAKRTMSISLDEAFRAALLLTGNMDAAKAAVLNGISVLEPALSAATSFWRRPKDLRFGAAPSLRNDPNRSHSFRPDFSACLCSTPSAVGVSYCGF